MLVGRWLGWLLCALGLVALGGDALALLQADSVSGDAGLLASLGEFWLRLDPNGPARLDGTLPDWIFPDWLEQALLTGLLPLPAAPVLLVAGLLLLLLFRKRAPKKARRFGALA